MLPAWEALDIDHQHRLQGHSGAEFKTQADGIAKVTQRQTHLVKSLQEDIDALNELAFREITQTMLDDAKKDPALQGNKANTLKDGDALAKLYATIIFLSKVKARAHDEKQPSGTTWLQTTLAEMLEIEPGQEFAPDSDTSERCVTELAAALRSLKVSVSLSKSAIKTLTNVDLGVR